MNFLKISESIKEQLQGEKCPKHGKKAVITFAGDSFVIKGCCDSFKLDIRNQIIELLDKETFDGINNDLDDILKRH